MSRNVSVLIVVLVILGIGWVLFNNSATTNNTTPSDNTGVGQSFTPPTEPATPLESTPSSQTATDSAMPQ